MTRTISFRKRIAIFGIPLVVLIFLVTLVQSSFFRPDSQILSFCITIDLLLTIPFLYYMQIRNTTIPITSIVPILLICFAVGSFVLPPQSQHYITLFKIFILPIIEIGLAFYVVRRIFKLRKQILTRKNDSLDLYTAIKNVCRDILPPRLSILVASELIMVYYVVFAWGKHPINEGEYTYHKRNASQALFALLILIIMVETVALHIFIANYFSTLAWIVTGLSVYTGFQFYGFAKSIARRPIQLTRTSLKLRYGILAEVDIPLQVVREVALTRKDISSMPNIKKLSPLGDLESHNVIIYLNEEIKITGPYGMKRKADAIALHMDDAKAFRERLISLQ